MKIECNCGCKEDGRVKSVFIVDSNNSNFDTTNIDCTINSFPRSHSVIFTDKESIYAYNKLMSSAIRYEIIDIDNGNVIHTF